MKFLRIGSTLLAALVVMGVMAVTACAATLQYTSYPNMSSGAQEGEHVFKVDGQSLKCTTVEFETDEAAAALSFTTAKSKYSGCTAFGFVGSTISMNRCHFRFGITGTFPNIHGGIEILCGTSGTGNIKIVSSSAFGTCEVEIAEQAGASAPTGLNTYANIEVGGVKKVKVTSNITGIDVTVVKDSGICPLSGTGTRTNSTYEGTTVMGATGGAGVFVG